MLTCEEYVDNLMSIKNIYQPQNQLIFYQDMQSTKWKCVFFLSIVKNLFLKSKSDHY